VFYLVVAPSICQAHEPEPLPVKFEHQLVKKTIQATEKEIVLSYPFENIADYPIVVDKFEESCGCMSGKWDGVEVPPGGKGEIKAVFTAKGLRGKVTKSLRVNFVGGGKVELAAQVDIAEVLGFSERIYDGQGNVNDYLDDTGEIIAHFSYDPFGNITEASIVPGGYYNFLYSTKMLDETGLYYYGYRYYDPMTGRWPSRDPIEENGGINLYGFSRNNPLSWYDYIGLKVKGNLVDNDPDVNSVICYKGKLDIQNKNSGPDRKCTGVHEYIHLLDWIERYGHEACKCAKDGQIPVGGEGYTEFLNDSECRAYKAGLTCRENLLKKTKNKQDRQKIEEAIERDKLKIKQHCP
jgi:RHS repeat-associated protein